MSDAVDNYLSHMGVEVDDEIKHFGVKGMKWGKRKAEGSSSLSSGPAGGGSAPAGPSRKEKRAANNKAIEEARERQRMRGIELERQAFKTYTAAGEKAVKAAVSKYDKLAEDLTKNPDAATANKMTSGEKAAAAVSWSLLGGLTVASIALNAAGSRR